MIHSTNISFSRLKNLIPNENRKSKGRPIFIKCPLRHLENNVPVIGTELEQELGPSGARSTVH